NRPGTGWRLHPEIEPGLAEGSGDSPALVEVRILFKTVETAQGCRADAIHFATDSLASKRTHDRVATKRKQAVTRCRVCATETRCVAQVMMVGFVLHQGAVDKHQ